MDEFEPTTTASKSDKWTLNQALLGLWFNRLLPALQNWEERKMNGNTEGGLRQLVSIIKTMLWAVKSSMEKEQKNKQNVIDIIKDLDNNSEEDKIYETIEYIESFLYTKGVLKWDTKEVLDRSKVWKMNQRFLG